MCLAIIMDFFIKLAEYARHPAGHSGAVSGSLLTGDALSPLRALAGLRTLIADCEETKNIGTLFFYMQALTCWPTMKMLDF